MTAATRDDHSLLADPRKAGLNGVAADGTTGIASVIRGARGASDSSASVFTPEGYISRTKLLDRALGKAGAAISGNGGSIGNVVSSMRSALDRAKRLARDFGVPQSVIEKIGGSKIAGIAGKAAGVAALVSGGLQMAASGELASWSAWGSGAAGARASLTGGVTPGAGTSENIRIKARAVLSDVEWGVNRAQDWLHNMMGRSLTDVDRAAAMLGGSPNRPRISEAIAAYSWFRKEVTAKYDAAAQRVIDTNLGRHAAGRAGVTPNGW